MNTILYRIREIAGKTPLKPVYKRVRKVYRNHYFRQTMEKISNNPGYSLDNRETLATLLYGWDNPPYSANVEFLSECVKYGAQSELPILECGSGLTTLILGLIAQKSGNAIWSLEHMKSWYERGNKYLAMYQIDSVNLIYSPLVDYGDFCWYQPPLDSMPEKFSLVICDGPPLATKGGRYGLIPIMKQKLIPGCVILLDNAGKKAEQANVTRWAQEMNLSYEICGTEIRYYVIDIR